MFIDTFNRGTKSKKTGKTQMGLLAKIQKSEENRKVRKEHYDEIFSLFKSNYSLPVREIGKRYGVTRQRIDQILRKYPEYTEIKQARFKARVPFDRSQTKEKTCIQCAKVFSAKYPYKTKYCSQDCLRIHMTMNEYPDWVGNRAIRPENFTKDEWRIINSIRTREYYNRHKETLAPIRKQYQRDRYKEFGHLYSKRAAERKKFGHAITPLNNPKNLGAIRP